MEPPTKKARVNINANVTTTLQECPILPELWVAHVIPVLSRFRIHTLASTCRFMHRAGSDHLDRQWKYGRGGYEYYESLLLEITPTLLPWCEERISLQRTLNRLEDAGYSRLADNLGSITPLAAAEDLLRCLPSYMSMGTYTRALVVVRSGRVALFKSWLRHYPQDFNRYTPIAFMLREYQHWRIWKREQMPVAMWMCIIVLKHRLMMRYDPIYLFIHQNSNNNN